jgi:acetyl-CoA carboxylase biotin carboxylase subunit
MFKKIVIANRGEVALRILHAASELGIKTVALYSTADSNLMHVKLADEAVCIGDAPVRESYLNGPAIITAAKNTHADAIHPGYGFFAEKAAFARQVASEGLVFIGPNPNTIASMRNKVEAVNTMRELGLSCVPGSHAVLRNDPQHNLKIAQELGYPVVIKAVFGGGGRAVHIVHTESNLLRLIELTQQEANGTFGSPDVYMEKYLNDVRHIEVQIMGDNYGNVVHFGDRDCSTQRWNKKIIEESLAPDITEEQRQKICNQCVEVAKKINYCGAGTFEFLYKDEIFYFIEMNTRIQVGHTVTEMLTDMDLVKDQIKIAAGETLSYQQKDIIFNGHAIQCRIYAEDPRTFVPSHGKVNSYYAPGGPGVRVDSHIYDGYIIPSNYDALIVKIAVHGDTREHAINRMSSALEELVIKGVSTNKTIHQAILHDADFIAGKFLTNYLEKRLGPKA